MLLSVGLTGCSSLKKVTIYPITDQDFSYIKKGQPSPITGYVMSEFYLEEVLKAKLED